MASTNYDPYDIDMKRILKEVDKSRIATQSTSASVSTSTVTPSISTAASNSVDTNIVTL